MLKATQFFLNFNDMAEDIKSYKKTFFTIEGLIKPYKYCFHGNTWY